jgi:hypothetical protein
MHFNWLVITTVGAFLTTASTLFGLGIGLGPFQLDLDGGFVDERIGDPIIVQRRVVGFDQPICYAIQKRKLLEMVVEWKEQVSDREVKRTVKQVTLQPYVFGTDQDRRLILRGNIVAENVLKQVTVKYGDEDQSNTNTKKKDENSAWSGVFHPAKKNGESDLSTINVERITQLRVIEQSNFKPPEDFNKIFKGSGIVNIICTVSSAD